jgi:hypothetical protein
MNLLQACIDVLFFHHPAAWWISGTVRAEREHCADDLAVRVLEAGHAGSRLSYAKALLALEERRQAHALALAANGGSLLDRIRRLAGVEEQPASPVRPLAAAAMASLLVAVLIMVAAPIREARADELPKDTNQIESLTVEQARKLVEEASGRTVGVTDHREPFECEGGPGAIPQQMLERLKIARHVAVEEGDADTRVDRKPAVLPGEHVGGGRGVEQPLHAEPPDHAAADPFGERGEVALGERPRRQERRRPIEAVRSWQEDAVGDTCVQMGVAVEPRAEAVEEGDGAEPGAGGRRRGLLRAAEALKTEQRLDLIQQNPRHGRDGLGAVGEEAPQPLRH